MNGDESRTRPGSRIRHHAELIIYPDADHGFLFQYPHQFAAEVNKFLTDA